MANVAEPPTDAVPEAVVSTAPPVVKKDELLTPIGAQTPTAKPEPAGEPLIAQAPPAPEEEPAAKPDTSAERLSSNPRINASLRRYEAGDVIAARQELNGMLAISRDPAEQAELRRHLRKIADATVFSRAARTDDPLVETYTIQSGEYLTHIARRYDVPHEAIMLINGITDAGRIRAGQKIKVPRGPFNLKIHKSRFRMDIYLQDLYVRSFPVGLGIDNGTPEGKWTVKNRLPNPTYYPPASAENKRIIPPDDPTNPLGEHWIGLEGTEGATLGRTGYGIHGTIEPESIGKAASMGCIRMHNNDVAFVYKLMTPGHSTVTTLP